MFTLSTVTVENNNYSMSGEVNLNFARFCHECITTALRAGNKECPTCRKKLVSRRSLRLLCVTQSAENCSLWGVDCIIVLNFFV